MRRFYVSMIVAAATLPAAGRADTISTLFNFPKQADGNSPAAPLLVLPSGALAGTTVSGGNDGCSALEAPSGCGTVFALLPGAAQGHWTETVLHVFDPRKGDGAAPAAALISDAFGNFYGTTSAGGGACKGKRGCGTVFELSPPGPGHAKWTETVLHAFAGPDGKYPQAALVRDSGGNLYGTT